MVIGDGRATAVDLEALEASGEERREVVDGVVVEKASPSGVHANAQTALATILRVAFDRAPGHGGRPGGWWLLVEARIQLERHSVFQPDVAGWRRERVATRPSETTIAVAPDWVCEVLSPSNASRDQVDKLRTYQRCGVGHYWIVDPRSETLTVYRHRAGEYVLALVAGRTERVRVEPFEAIEFPVGVLFGDEFDS